MKRLMCLVLCVILLLPAAAALADVPSGYTSDSHNLVAYRIVNASSCTVDMKIFVDNAWRTITFSDGGIHCFNYTLEGDESNLRISVEPTFSADGKTCKALYSVKNTGNEPVKFIFTLYADTMVDGLDSSSNKLQGKTIKMANNNSGVVLVATFTPSASSHPVPTHYDNMVYSGDPTNTPFMEDCSDSAFVTWWDPVTLAPNATATFCVGVSGQQLHEHEFSYAVTGNGNAITATCADNDGKCSLTNKQVTITLRAENTIYSGQPVPAELDDEAWAIDLNVPAILYEGVDGTSYGPTNSAPTETGKYKASIIVNGNAASTVYQITASSPLPTGDSTNFYLLSLLLLISASGMVLMFQRHSRRHG